MIGYVNGRFVPLHANRFVPHEMRVDENSFVGDFPKSVLGHGDGCVRFVQPYNIGLVSRRETSPGCLSQISFCRLTLPVSFPGSWVMSQQYTAQIDTLRSAAPVVAPSLLACDFANLEREIRAVEEAGAKVLHLDIMDGHFVPNLSFGLPVVRAIRRVSTVTLDVHLMISQPGRYLERFREAGADFLTIHIEEEPHPQPLLEQIRSLGAAAGLSLNPPTPVSAIEPYLEWCDQVLVMSVMPGFGGQAFDPVALEKLARLREVAPSRLLLSVDGGVGDETMGPCVQAGAQMLVTGTAFFRFDDYQKRLAELTRIANSSKDE